MKHFLQAITDLGRMKGRMTRNAFLRFMLFFIVFWFVALMVDQMTSEFFSFRVVLTVYNILMIPTILSAMVRRLHDTGNRARWLLTLTILAVFVIFSTFVTLSSCFLDVKNNTYLDVMLLLFFPSLFTIGALIYKLCQKGKRGANKYGPDPVEVKMDEGEGVESATK